MRAQDMLEVKGTRVETIDDGATLSEAIDQLADLRIGALLVVRANGQPCGILSERDIVRLLAGAPKGFRDSPVRDVMSPNLITCGLDATVDELLDLMTNRRIRHVPVIHRGELRGLLSIGDVIKHRIREVKEEAEALKSYIAGA